jgi:transposase
MGATRRRFTLEFKTEAARRVIDTGRSIAEQASARQGGGGSVDGCERV